MLGLGELALLNGKQSQQGEMLSIGANFNKMNRKNRGAKAAGMAARGTMRKTSSHMDQGEPPCPRHAQ